MNKTYVNDGVAPPVKLNVGFTFGSNVGVGVELAVTEEPNTKFGVPVVGARPHVF